MRDTVEMVEPRKVPLDPHGTADESEGCATTCGCIVAVLVLSMGIGAAVAILWQHLPHL